MLEVKNLTKDYHSVTHYQEFSIYLCEQSLTIAGGLLLNQNNDVIARKFQKCYNYL